MSKFAKRSRRPTATVVAHIGEHTLACPLLSTIERLPLSFQSRPSLTLIRWSLLPTDRNDHRVRVPDSALQALCTEMHHGTHELETAAQDSLGFWCEILVLEVDVLLLVWRRDETEALRIVVKLDGACMVRTARCVFRWFQFDTSRIGCHGVDILHRLMHFTDHNPQRFGSPSAVLLYLVQCRAGPLSTIFRLWSGNGSGRNRSVWNTSQKHVFLRTNQETTTIVRGSTSFIHNTLQHQCRH